MKKTLRLIKDLQKTALADSRALYKSIRETTCWRQTMKNLFILATLLLFVSCEKITANGVIETTEEITLSKSGKKNRVTFNPDGTVKKIKKPVTIPAGQYKGEFKISSKKTTKLKFHNVPGQKKKAIIEFSIPKDAKLPTVSGTFYLTAQQVKQPYAIAGSLATEYSQSGQTNTYESCTYYVEEYICRTKYERRCRTRRDGSEYCRDVPRQVCRYETVSRNGSQDVSYHYSYTQRDFVVNLVNPATKAQASTFTGRHNSSKKVYDYKGTCR